MDKSALFNISYGLYVCSTLDKGRPTGCIVDAVAQVSTDPLCVMIAVMKKNYTNEIIKNDGRVCISILSDNAEMDTFKRFGFQSGRNVDKFDGFPHEFTKSGLPYITTQANAYFSGQVVFSREFNTHTVFFVQVEEAEKLNDDEPITYAAYRKRLKK